MSAPDGLVTIGSLFFVGLLLVGMGLSFGMTGAAVPILRTGFFIAGGAMVPSGLFMSGYGVVLWLRRANAQRLRANGLPGQARIVAMRQTIMYVNRQPVVELQLEVMTATHAPYAVKRREIVPLISMGRLTNGLPLPVMVDPANPQNLVILWESEQRLPSGFGS